MSSIIKGANDGFDKEIRITNRRGKISLQVIYIKKLDSRLVKIKKIIIEGYVTRVKN
jgi:hypothetical protein